MKALPLLVWNVWPGLKLFKSRSNFIVKIKIHGTTWNVLNVARNTHVQYESPTFSDLKVMAKIKVFQK